jgi:hypothetical protein
MGRRLLLFVVKPSTSLESSSAQNVCHVHVTIAPTGHVDSKRQLSVSKTTHSILTIRQIHSQVPSLPPKNHSIQSYPRRSLPFPCPLPNLLQDRSRHDTTQDCSWSCGNGEVEGLRRNPTTIRQEAETSCASGIASDQIEARKEVLHRWPIRSRIRLEISGCCC